VVHRCHYNWGKRASQYRGLARPSVHKARRCIQRNIHVDKIQKRRFRTSQPKVRSQLYHPTEARGTHHCLQAYTRQNKALVYQTIEHFSGRFNNRHIRYFRGIFIFKEPKFSLPTYFATAKEKPTPGSTSSTISIASFQKGTMVFKPVRLKSSSIKSSVTSQKYSWPGNEQNQLIHVSVDVGVEDAEPRPIVQCQIDEPEHERDNMR
jgi:hypothetical protein